MVEDRRSWPLIVGVTAGLVGSIVAGVVLYSIRSQREPNSNLEDAEEIIARCHEKIKEIESSLVTLK